MYSYLTQEYNIYYAKPESLRLYTAALQYIINTMQQFNMLVQIICNCLFKSGTALWIE